MRWFTSFIFPKRFHRELSKNFADHPRLSTSDEHLKKTFSTDLLSRNATLSLRPAGENYCRAR
jgi:hypothetical protein